MAMRIGGEYRADAIAGRHWRRFAEANRLDPEAAVMRIDALAERAPDCFEQAAQAETVQSLGSKLPARLVERMALGLSGAVRRSPTTGNRRCRADRPEAGSHRRRCLS
jgi:hypothetical protein